MNIDVACAAIACTVAAAVTVGIGAAARGAAHAQGVSLPWAASAPVKGYSATTRLVAGARPAAGDARALFAGVEIRMAEGWKTYWRHPGDAGGVPPAFDWTGSSNLASARVLYPVPERLADANGYSIGYKKLVVFPVVVKPIDASKPVTLKLAFEYGVCREICVPAEARLELTVPPTVASMPPDLASALDRVPHTGGDAKAAPAAPSLKGASAVLSGPEPGMAFEIATGATGVVDLFIEVPGGAYLPMTEKVGAATGGVQRFRIDLKGVEDFASLKGKPLRMTITTTTGGIEAEWVVR